MSWTYIKTLIYIDDPLKRDFYLQMCPQEGWSTRTLRQTGTITPAWVLKDP